MSPFPSSPCPRPRTSYHRSVGATALAALLVLALAACGGGPAPAPSGLTASTDIAASGATVTFTGANLGTGGTVTIGGVPATASSWTPDSITVTVPTGAPQGPQQAEVTTGGVTQSVPLFVGVDFPAGTLEQLAALALPRGTAVRLGAGRFAAATPELALDNLSLYGRGAAATTVAGPAWPDPLYLNADAGYDLVLADLTLETGFTAITATPLVAPGSLATDPDLSAALLSATGPADLLTALQATPVTTLAAADGSYELRDVNITPVPGAPGGILATLPGFSGVPEFYGGDLHLHGVTAANNDLVLYGVVGGDLDIAASRLQVGGAMLMSMGGTVAVDASTLSAGLETMSEGLMLTGMRGIELTGSDFSVKDGDLVVASGYTPLGGSYLAADFTVTDSTFSVTDEDPADADDLGELTLGLGRGTATVTGNIFKADRGMRVEAVVPGSLAVTFAANTVTAGKAGIASAWFGLVGGPMQVSELDGNTITFLSEGVVGFEIGAVGPSGVTSFTNNTVTGSGSGTALTVQQGSAAMAVSFEATGNTFTGFANALHLAADSAVDREPFTARINDNVFDFVIDAAPKTATLDNMTVALSDLDATRNVWGTNTDAATVAGYVTALGSTEAGVLEVAPLTLP